jgi:hypothetical protein
VIHVDIEVITHQVMPPNFQGMHIRCQLKIVSRIIFS